MYVLTTNIAYNCSNSGKAMKHSTRLKQLLTILINANDYITSQEIATQLHVSTRTVFNDLNSDAFRKVLNGANLIRKEKTGIKLEANEKQFKRISYILYDNDFIFAEKNGYFTEVENLLLYFMHTKNTTTKKELADNMYVDQNNLEPYINKANSYIKDTNVVIESKQGLGITLVGTENNIRKMFKRLISDILKKDTKFNAQAVIDRVSNSSHHYLELIFGKDILNGVMEIVSISEVNLNETYTDFDFENLIIKQCIRLERIQNNHRLVTMRRFNNDVREYLIAQLMNAQIKNRFNVSLDEFELNDLTENIISTRRINYNSYSSNMTENSIANEFTRLISAGLGIDLTNDTELAINLIKHLIPAIRRMKYGIQIENPLLKQIKFDYTREYIIVMTCIEEIEKKQNIKIDQNELGYICLHVVAAVNRHTKERTIKAILLCDDGLTFHSFLKSKIEHQFNEIKIIKSVPTTDFARFDTEEYDLLINASKQVYNNSTKTIQISMLLTDLDQNTIRAWIINREYQLLTSLEHEIRKNIFFFKDKANSRDELIERYSKFLEIDGYVTKEFSESAINREQTISTALGRGIAIPHGSDDFVINSATLIIQLDHPIDWDNQSVDLIFLLAINKSDIHEFRYFIEKVYSIITNENQLKRLKTAKSTKEIETLLFVNQCNA